VGGEVSNGLRLSAFFHHALASGLLITGACTERGTVAGGGLGPGDGTPPELTGLSFLDAATLELTFSEAMAPADDVDPAKFRLSVSASVDYSYYGYDEVSTYYSQAYLRGDEVCDEYCYPDYYTGEEYCYEYCDFERIPVDPVDVRSASSERIVVDLDPPIDATLCDRIDELEDYPVVKEAGLFLHYSNNGLPTLTDEAGTPLDAIGEAWVLKGESAGGYYGYYGYHDFVRGEYPNIDPHRPIPCPDGL